MDKPLFILIYFIWGGVKFYSLFVFSFEEFFIYLFIFYYFCSRFFFKVAIHFEMSLAVSTFVRVLMRYT